MASKSARFSVGLTLLSAFDVFVLVLTWLEYRTRRSPAMAEAS
jgi:uncharacterized membrane protein